MVLVTFAATLPINPPSASPVLTSKQVWAGLIEKCLRPQTGFVKAIKDCTVESRSADVIERTVKFEEGFMMGDQAKERIELQEGHSAEFVQANGQRVLNLLSQGRSSEDLYLTFAFNLPMEGVEAGSPEAVAKRGQFEKASVVAIESTIATIRKFVEEGREHEMGK